MKAIILTVEQIRKSSGRNYNPQVWDSNIDRMITNYSNVVFYLVCKDEVYGYDRYFVEYTLSDGLRLFKSFDYISSITNGGFFRLDKFKYTEDGKSMSDVIDLAKENNYYEASELMDELENSKFIQLSYSKFTDADGNLVVIGNSNEERDWMTKRSKIFGVTFTKGI